MLITQTPLRISLAGGGTDLPDYYKHHGGYVVSTAIDKYIYVIINSRYDDKIYIDYSKKEIVDHVDDIQHDLVREAAKLTGMKNGFEVAMMADIPSEGSGLGSSSSLTVGLLNAFYHYQGKQVERELLARQACEIEIVILGRPIGKQDQYIAAYGGLCGFEFQQEGDVDVEPLALNHHQKRQLGSNLLLFFTDIVRKSSSILDEQKEKISDREEAHHGIKELARRAYQELLSENYTALGDILHQNWELKKELASGVTTSEIDQMYEQAMEAGATGGKISGAGGGGFLLCYCPRSEQERVREALGGYREMPFMLEPLGSRVIFHQERYRW